MGDLLRCQGIAIFRICDLCNAFHLDYWPTNRGNTDV